MTLDPFELPPIDDEPPPGVARDQWRRPLIHTGTGDLEPYTRISTIAGQLDGGWGLAKWKIRHAVVGVARHEALAGMLAGLDPTEDKDRIDEIAETAMDRAGVNDKADYGTAIHTFTEPGKADYAPARMRSDVDAYLAAMDAIGAEAIATELFVVVDSIKVAGTLDHLWRVPGLGVVAVDKKTGSYRPKSCAIQLACYARGLVYDPARPRLRKETGARHDRAIVAHIPAGTGTCQLHVVDTDAGWRAAQAAAFAHGWGRTGDSAISRPLDTASQRITEGTPA